MQLAIIKNPIDVTNALEELGLRADVLRDAMVSGENARDACTVNDPQSAPGFFSYTHTTRRLAELLIPLGWARKDSDGLALIVSPSGDMAIIIGSGDEGTGVSDHPVRSRYPKGPATKMAVEQNRQLELFPRATQPQESTGTRRTWLLLRRRIKDRLYAELSLPYEVGEDDHVVEWSRRIILEPVSFEPDVHHEEDAGQPINIDIQPRS
jgi:hypothetical protein